jgi:N-methylhydantoinase A
MDRENMGSNITLGIDVGGTFTDILAFDHDKGTIFSAFKVPSTPQNPALAAIIGVDRFLGRTGMCADVVFHGTTVGTNALIQKRGSRTALITTKGQGSHRLSYRESAASSCKSALPTTVPY